MDTLRLGLDWGPYESTEDVEGPMEIRYAKPTQAFWSLWKKKKQEIRNAGVFVTKKDEKWLVFQKRKARPAQQAKRKKQIAKSVAKSSTAVFACPKNLSYLPYQCAGIEYALGRTHCLIGDEMGLGKTIQAIGVLNQKKIKKALIICPASLKRNWKKELKKWLVDQTLSVGIAESKDKLPQTNVVIINYDIVKKKRKEIDKTKMWDVLILDECQYLKNPKAQRTAAVYGNGHKRKSTQLLPIPAKKVLALSGTPIVNRPVELWPLLKRIDPQGLGRSYMRYVERYCDPKLIHIGQGRKAWDYRGASNLGDLQERLRASVMVRRLKEDVLDDLPPKVRQILEIDPPKGLECDQYAEYMAELNIAVLEAERTNDLKSFSERVAALESSHPINFDEMAEYRQILAEAKVPYIVSHLENILEEGPVLLFMHHHNAADSVAEAFKGVAVQMNGKTAMGKRQQLVEDFQAGKYELFISSIKEGYTLTRSSHVVFGEGLWTPGEMLQFEDRTHRIGQKASVLVQQLVFAGTLDVTMAKTVNLKARIIEGALN